MNNYKKTNRFFSYQAKQALFYAMLEAKNNKLDLVTSKYIFYGLIKSNPSLLNKIITTLYKKNGRFSVNMKNFIYRCQISLKNEKTIDSFNSTSSQIMLSKTVRNLLYSLTRSSKMNKDIKSDNKQYIVITTFSIFLNLLKSKSIKNWLKDEIFIVNK